LVGSQSQAESAAGIQGQTQVQLHDSYGIATSRTNTVHVAFFFFMGKRQFAGTGRRKEKTVFNAKPF
jgi:hypothetical protein